MNVVPLASLRSGTDTRLDEDGLALCPLSGVDGDPAVVGSVLAPITTGFGYLGFFGSTDSPTFRGMVARLNGTTSIEARIRLMAASTSALAPADPRNASIVLTSPASGSVGIAQLNADTTINGDLSVTGAMNVGQNVTALAFIPQCSA